MDAWALLHRFKADWRLLVPLLALNLAGMAFGYYYYWQVGQFDPSSQYYQPPWTWPLVADSPNAVLVFFVAALAFRLKGWRNKWLDAGAFTLNVYVGLWTTALFLSYPSEMGTFEYGRVLDGHANPVLFVAHMGMPMQALVLVPDMRRDRWHWPSILAVLAVLTVYVGVDYWGPHLHPAPFLHQPGTSDDVAGLDGDRLLHAFAPGLMVVTAFAWLAVLAARRRRVQDPLPAQDLGPPA